MTHTWCLPTTISTLFRKQREASTSSKSQAAILCGQRNIVLKGLQRQGNLVRDGCLCCSFLRHASLPASPVHEHGLLLVQVSDKSKIAENILK